MAEKIIKDYEQLSEIRKYLIKKGQSRYKGSIALNKLNEAEIYLNNSKDIFSTLSNIKDKSKISLITETYDKICSLFAEIAKFCVTPSLEMKSEKMDFDLKTACSFIPLLDDREDTTKRLIDAVEMYADMLSSEGQQLLIKFVLKDGLKNEKLSTIIAARNYTSLKEAIQAAKDESTPSSSTQAEVMNISSFPRGRGRYNNRSFRFQTRGRGFQTNYHNYNNRGTNFQNNNNNFNRYQGNRFQYTPRGRGQNMFYNNRKRYNNKKGNFNNRILALQNDRPVRTADNVEHPTDERESNQFFRT
ncbi:unnamed protein product [Parnassius mnemosyne]|uniref:Uncharacterized protein n=1 Tax=Parnassius mnemosyne TaxID=213953 RepID=A0AAV1KUV5_9NEOP